MLPFLISNVQGTGSCPWPPHGWHRPIRFKVSHPPFKGPYFFMASIPNWEHVGVYLHDGPSQGEIISWYIFINPIKGSDMICFADLIERAKLNHTNSCLEKN